MGTTRARAIACVGLLLAGLSIACGDDPLAAGERCLQATSLSIGNARNGRLATGDLVFDGAYIDYYSVRLSGTATLTARMTSSQVDPFLYLLDEDRGFLQQGYSDEELGPAFVSAELPAGCYILGASSWPRRDEPNSAGLYSILTDTTGAITPPSP